MTTPEPPAQVLDAAPGLWSAAGQAHWLTVAGVSMAPFLRPGDEVLVAHAPARLRRGDVVVLLLPVGLVTHRLIGAEPWAAPEKLWTQGDNNAQADPVASGATLLGRVRAVRRSSRQMNLAAARWRLFGWVIALSLLSLDRLGAAAGPFAMLRLAAARTGRRLLTVFRRLACQ